ncbi:MAG: Mth938-like domain-containing protein [Xanthomonadaceae bacterium]|jgi:uncharacterized protein|nr:Mth938-like domain-containing protein [Xanthomonadaceae bacterium]
MPLSQERPDFRHVPRAVDAAGRVTINARRLERSFFLDAGTLVEDWRPARVDELAAEDFAALLALRPAVILLGTGPRLRFPAASVRAAVLVHGVGLEVMDNAAAARTFMVLAAEGRAVVAAFLVDPAEADGLG